MAERRGYCSYTPLYRLMSLEVNGFLFCGYSIIRAVVNDW